VVKATNSAKVKRRERIEKAPAILAVLASIASGGIRESHAVKDILFCGGVSGWHVIKVQSLCRDRPGAAP